jgi:hypothetical protein
MRLKVKKSSAAMICENTAASAPPRLMPSSHAEVAESQIHASETHSNEIGTCCKGIITNTDFLQEAFNQRHGQLNVGLMQRTATND